jgi:hypothetical protein
MKFNFLNIIITGACGALVASFSPNPLIFVPLAAIVGLVCSYFIPIFDEDS